MQSQLLLCLAASLSISLPRSLSLPLPPSSSSRCTPLTQLLPRPASSAASGIHSKKTHSTWRSAQTTLTQRGKGGGGSNRRGSLKFRKAVCAETKTGGYRRAECVNTSFVFHMCVFWFFFPYSFAVSVQKQTSVICHVSCPKFSLNAAAERL